MTRVDWRRKVDWGRWLVVAAYASLILVWIAFHGLGAEF